MTRQVFELLSTQSDQPVINHITSLKYLNPANKPDAWEEKGLLAFEQETPEVSEIATMNGLPYLRLLKPFMTEASCLKCHGRQGYQVGDVRGGISIGVPMQPYLETEARERRRISLTHLVLWIIGMGGIIVSTRKLRDKEAERKKLEDQLRHAQKMEAVGRLAGGVAHDFNNILTAVIGYSSLSLMKIGKDDPIRHNMEEVIKASRRGANLTQSLLAFSRKQIIDPRPMELNSVIDRVAKLLARLIGEDIKLETKLSDADLVVVADSSQLEQVLMNLATNARDAMPDGGLLQLETGRMTLDERFIAANNYGKPGNYAVISFTDTGVGMDAKTAERIFEPFFTTKEVGRGTGLGLSMAYGIVKQHEGYINVYSAPGKGTTFRIYLPLSQAAARSPEPDESVEPTRGGAETILVAEDDAPIRKLTTALLGEFGYRVIEAVDGEDAIEKIRIHGSRIDLLLLDVIMPRKNGREVYEEAKKLVPNVKVLFTSGYTADIIQKKGIIEEGQDFISKPVSPGELLKKIRESLER
jgi:signal transduction histidine kinase/CheY-like chemotaxis protein